MFIIYRSFFEGAQLSCDDCFAAAVTMEGITAMKITMGKAATVAGHGGHDLSAMLATKAVASAGHMSFGHGGITDPFFGHDPFASV